MLVGSMLIVAAGCSGGKDEKSAAAFPDSIVDADVIAKVNNYTIRGGELKTFSAMFGMASRGQMPEREYNEKLLDEYIRRVLLWQEAVALGGFVDDSTTQAIFDDFQASVGGEEVFAQRLEEAGITRGDLLQSIQRDLVIRQFLDTHFSEESAVDEAEAASYYEQNEDQFSTPDSVRARHILLEVQAGDSDEVKQEKRQRIEQILAEARSGKDFAQLAQQYSEGPSSTRGGDLGFFRRGEMVQPFDSVAFALKVGQISDVVETRYGFHIIKVEDRKDGRKLGYDEVKENLITQMEQQKMVEAVQNHLNEIMNVAIIERNYTP